MNKKGKKFGNYLKELRFKTDLAIRDICRRVDYDASNWSKIERGKISPPKDRNVLKKWAGALGLSSKEKEQFFYRAEIAQGIIPADIMDDKELVDALPAFFRTFKNKRPTKKEVDKLIEIIRKA